MRVALFGGSFDPIHRGHLAIARTAAEAFSLTKVLFAPTGQQPLKPGGATASFKDRLAMATLACSLAKPLFEASAIDAPHLDGSPNYTVDALTTLREQHPDAVLYIVAGLDSFLELPRWRQPDRLIALADWIVVSRPGYTLDLAPYTQEQRQRIHCLNTIHDDVSATDLRQRIQHGEPYADLLPDSVAAYIAAHKLYQPTL